MEKKSDDTKKFYRLIDKKIYQVFLFACPGNIPFNFFLHHWFVLNKKGNLSRWEFLFRKNTHKKSGGHLYRNFFPPFQGIEIFYFSQKYFWKGKLVKHIGGGKNSPAYRAIKLIENSKNKYPYNYRYFLTGPNSNTYIQWVLKNFPEFKVKLSWNSFGKNYKIENS